MVNQKMWMFHVQRVQSILERYEIDIAVVMEDSNRSLLMCNEKFCEMFNIPLSPKEMIGQNCEDSAESSKFLFKNPDEFITRINTILLNRESVNKEEVELANGDVLIRSYYPHFLDDVYMGHTWEYQMQDDLGSYTEK